MSKYKEYYIAFIDVLGFKQMISCKACEDIVDIYGSIKAMRTLQRHIDDSGKTEPLIPPEEIHIKVMSDSVCIYINSDLPDSLFELAFICMDFQGRMIEKEPPILLRGAITKGKLYSDGDCLFGPGFVNAYLMEENNARVPRIIINKEIVDDYNNRFKDRRFPEALLNRDFDAFYYIEYISAYGLTDRSKLGKYGELYEYIENVLNSTTDDSIRNKYLYLESKILPLMNQANYK